MKTIKRTLCAVLLLSMLLTALVGCGGTSSGDDTSGADTGNGTGTEASTDAETKEETLELPENLNYDGYEFVVLVAGNYANNDFEVAESDDLVNEAKFKKNKQTESLLGVKIKNEDVVSFGSTRGAGPGFSAFQQSYISGSEDYDLGVIGAYDCATLAYNGLLSDLNTLPNMDLDHSWWDQNARQDLSVKNKLYFTAGDISLTYRLVTHCIMFSKELLKQNANLRNPYELVHGNNWTFDTFGEEIKKVTADVNANSERDKGDLYGLLSWNDPHVAVLTAAGEKIVTIKDNGSLELTVYTDRSDSALRKYCEILFDTEHAFNYQYNAPSAEWNTTRDAMFNENRALYYMTTFVTVSRHRDKETDFGILPYPKYDAEQDRYYHTDTPFSTSFVCVSVIADDPARTGAVMEALSYYSKQYMTPAYYQKTLVGTYFRDDESEEMLDLIFATRCYDLGCYYNVGSIATELTSMLNSRKYTFASLCARVSDAAEQQIKDINEKYSGLNQ